MKTRTEIKTKRGYSMKTRIEIKLIGINSGKVVTMNKKMLSDRIFDPEFSTLTDIQNEFKDLSKFIETQIDKYYTHI